jgi:hypothetical protein
VHCDGSFEAFAAWAAQTLLSGLYAPASKQDREQYVLVVYLGGILNGSVKASEQCRNELHMFERDVRIARENNERVFWRLVAANYQRRVIRYSAPRNGGPPSKGSV